MGQKRVANLGMIREKIKAYQMNKKVRPSIKSPTGVASPVARRVKQKQSLKIRMKSITRNHKLPDLGSVSPIRLQRKP